MTNPPPNRGTPDDRNRAQPESLGGADAVEKTSYVVGSGTDPERTRSEPADARKGNASAAPNATVAIIVFLLVGAVLVYVLGWGR